MADNIPITAGAGTSVATDDVAGQHIQIMKLADGTPDSATRIKSGGGVEADALRVTVASDSTGVLSVDDNGGILTVDGTVITVGDAAHDAADTGNPIKVGARARSALITAVANNDRSDLIADLFGRLLVAAIDPAQQVFKSAAYTTQQTGIALWTPAAGKKVAITHAVFGVGGVTGGDITLWFGDSADTVYTAGTDQLVGLWHVIPSATIKQAETPPPLVPPVPIFCTTADRILRVTTSAGITLDVAVYGYEW